MLCPTIFLLIQFSSQLSILDQSEENNALPSVVISEMHQLVCCKKLSSLCVCVFFKIVSPLGKTEQYTLIKFGLPSKQDMFLTFAVARARGEFVIDEIHGLVLCICFLFINFAKTRHYKN